MKGFIKNILLLAISISLSVGVIWLAGEAILRIKTDYAMDDADEMYTESPNRILNKELKPGYDGEYYGSKVNINSAGFRDREFNQSKDAGIYRIVVLGDSMTFGPAVALDNIYPKALESFLNKNVSGSTGKKIEVLNFSVPGYNTIQEYELLRTKAVYYDPDLVILGFFFNDVKMRDSSPLESTEASKDACAYDGFVRFLSRVKQKSLFAQFALSHLAVIARRAGLHRGYISSFRGAYAENNKSWHKCRSAILSIGDFAKSNNAKFLVIVIPFLSDLNDYHPLKKEIEVVGDFLKKNRIKNVNLFPYFYEQRAESFWINPINGHPNRKGHAVMAEAVGDYILKERLIN